MKSLLSEFSTEKALWWILGAIIAPLIITGANTVQDHTKRIAAIEGMMSGMNQRLGRIELQLDHISERFDEIMNKVERKS